MTIRVGEVEEPFAPFGILRCRVWTVAGRNHARMERVNVGMVEDNTSPPRPISLGRLGDEIEIICSSSKARKRCVITTMNDLKSQRAIEADGARHIVGSQRDRTDALDHRENAPLRLRSCRIGALRSQYQDRFAIIAGEWHRTGTAEGCVWGLR